MPTGNDKEEGRMRKNGYGRPRWSFVLPARETVARFRRWNVVLIVVLAFLVLGVFVAAKAPEPGGSASGAARTLVKN
jgi:hypothetical protein